MKCQSLLSTMMTLSTLFVSTSSECPTTVHQMKVTVEGGPHEMILSSPCPYQLYLDSADHVLKVTLPCPSPDLTSLLVTYIPWGCTTPVHRTVPCTQPLITGTRSLVVQRMEDVNTGPGGAQVNATLLYVSVARAQITDYPCDACLSPPATVEWPTAVTGVTGECVWEVQGGTALITVLHFTDFSLSQTPSCDDEYLQLDDTRYCGTTLRNITQTLHGEKVSMRRGPRGAPRGASRGVSRGRSLERQRHSRMTVSVHSELRGSGSDTRQGEEWPKEAKTAVTALAGTVVLTTVAAFICCLWNICNRRPRQAVQRRPPPTSGAQQTEVRLTRAERLTSWLFAEKHQQQQQQQEEQEQQHHASNSEQQQAMTTFTDNGYDADEVFYANIMVTGENSVIK